MSAPTEARRQIEAYCQSLVDIGAARWLINDDGDTELHLRSGEVYVFGDWGVTQLGGAEALSKPAVDSSMRRMSCNCS